MMSRRGFTLIEMVVVMTVVSMILAATVVLMHFVLQWTPRSASERTRSPW